jgi:hypothetical protein
VSVETPSKLCSDMYLQLHLDSPPHISPFDRRIARAGHGAALRSYSTQRPSIATRTIVDVADVYGGEIHANAHKRGDCDLCQASFTDYCDVRQFFRLSLKRTSDLSHGLIEIMRVALHHPLSHPIDSTCIRRLTAATLHIPRLLPSLS